MHAMLYKVLNWNENRGKRYGPGLKAIRSEFQKDFNAFLMELEKGTPDEKGQQRPIKRSYRNTQSRLEKIRLQERAKDTPEARRAANAIEFLKQDFRAAAWVEKLKKKIREEKTEARKAVWEEHVIPILPSADNHMGLTSLQGRRLEGRVRAAVSRIGGAHQKTMAKTLNGLTAALEPPDVEHKMAGLTKKWQ
ncbi:MAG: hypothetical protein Q8P02_00555 [Candidatus Micrarchaeota archaeon]|nr:hypothetical protein [Candidatus Micrarchaeota archaeon]